MECSANCWEIVEAIATMASVLAMIFMTIYFHNINNEITNKDKYFRYIIDLYYRIEDDIKQLKCNTSNKLAKSVQNQIIRQIKVKCTLMIYYLKKYPGFYGNRTRFEYLLNEIIEKPEDEINYDYLSNAFRDFCLNVKKDSKGESIHIYIKRKEVGFSEKE